MLRRALRGSASIRTIRERNVFEAERRGHVPAQRLCAVHIRLDPLRQHEFFAAASSLYGIGSGGE